MTNRQTDHAMWQDTCSKRVHLVLAMRANNASEMAEVLPRNQVNGNCFVLSPHLTSISAHNR